MVEETQRTQGGRAGGRTGGGGRLGETRRTESLLLTGGKVRVRV